ncbi:MULTISPECIES: hypothetical protein [Acidiplasma]|jgi:hypothetical protein|uniref:Uncharacterized protein n=2 Tax=Acidiplasma TaxID=507753 RepID=A0A0Q0VR87_9ARCH|nr:MULTISPECIES: hypothetical protein [Acidiplasma]KPV46774.1 hypothetical protein SE19_04070 [Acidiplasma aeolicum]KQB33670.1 hypothetical protein AOG55_02360 [Acidiplasma cupricumulans]KQB34236.1 hypothetical protein AOG54_05430 [Acidiplasma aeolicum]WMT55829.1 MAG: hypothetical protein RE470_04075 [Acidiplasma sp.]
MVDDREVIGFTLDEEPKWVKVTLEDGTVMQIKMEIMAIERNGNDPNTGIPVYIIQATNIMRMLKVPKELIKTTNDRHNSSGLYS